VLGGTVVVLDEEAAELEGAVGQLAGGATKKKVPVYSPAAKRN